MKNCTGDHCQPPRSSLTIEEDSVDRRLIDAVVRNELWSTNCGKPGYDGSPVFSVSGVSLNRCQ